MAYNNYQIEVPISAAAAAWGTANTTVWHNVGYHPVVIRAFALVVTTTFDTAPNVLTMTKRILIGSDTGASAITTLTVPTSTAAGKVVYKGGLEIKLNPGDELKVANGGETTAGAGTLLMLIEPSWELPANNTDMVLSA